MSDHDRIAKAMSYIVDRLTDQPHLEEIAAHVHLSPFHFQRLFCRWAGTTPKRFQQALTLEHGKALLDDSRSLLETSGLAGLSSGSRLHDHFVQLEAVTPGEYRNKGRDLEIEYGVHPTPFGLVFAAVTKRGVCRAAFLDFVTIEEQLADIRNAWPFASLTRNDHVVRGITRAMFSRTKTVQRPLSLHVAGTNFQIAVWKALLRIPRGSVASYAQIAARLGRPKAARAVGRAVGSNPVAFVIPCHRVIQQSGALGGYRWGQTKKLTIQVWERAQPEPDAP